MLERFGAEMRSDRCVVDHVVEFGESVVVEGASSIRIEKITAFCGIQAAISINVFIDVKVAVTIHVLIDVEIAVAIQILVPVQTTIAIHVLGDIKTPIAVHVFCHIRFPGTVYQFLLTSSSSAGDSIAQGAFGGQLSLSHRHSPEVCAASGRRGEA